MTGDTVTNTSGGGINPFVVFGIDLSYTVPRPYLPMMHKITFDLNVQNLFNQHFFQYFYSQTSPGACGNAGFGAETKYFGSGKQTTNPGPGQGQPQTVTPNNYSCSTEFADAIPGQPFSVFFTVTARF